MSHFPIRVAKYVVKEYTDNEIVGLSLYDGSLCKIMKLCIGKSQLDKLQKGAIFIERIWLEQRNDDTVECKQITFTGETYLPDLDLLED